MNVAPLESLALRWREEADLFRKRGGDLQARVLDSVAEDFEEALRDWQLETLTLEAAAEESGFAYSTLQQRVTAGDLPNAGEKGSPRIRRCDLPQRGGRGGPKASPGEPDLSARVMVGR